MRSPRCTSMSVAAAAAVALIPIATHALAEDATCASVFNAGERTMQTPNHQYATQTGGPYGAQGKHVETIHLDGVSYIQVDGRWHKSPLDRQAMMAQERENRRNARNVHCEHLRDEAIDGEAAAVFSTHYENDVAKTDSLTWISKRSGVYLRQELDMNLGGLLGKTHTSIRTSYAGVQAPAGVK